MSSARRPKPWPGSSPLTAEEDFLAFVEGKIRAHPDMFPLLTRYYLDPLA